ncbi:protein kinase-like protein [Ophiocordyceps camponoti-floridani]|uniref:Protein kinase-like protein n=1 Tax=Ophiocordyceps camponoti-floridani TaxID=2030778 RepID=A0A8H4Q0K4_9HYPO|nr:protein kinase-like protein [Ophiocordyceps camponoti-floridani]
MEASRRATHSNTRSRISRKLPPGSSLDPKPLPRQRCSRQASRSPSAASVRTDASIRAGFVLAACALAGSLLAYVVHLWSDASGVTVPGLLAAVIALLTDSWQMMALGDPQFRLPPLTAARVTIHDAFCLGLSMGDIIMILLLKFRGDYKDSTLDLYRQAARAAYQSPPREKWLGVAVWSLTLMVTWRIYFIIGSCWDCYKKHRRGVAQGQRRRNLV